MRHRGEGAGCFGSGSRVVVSLVGHPGALVHNKGGNLPGLSPEAGLAGASACGGADYQGGGEGAGSARGLVGRGVGGSGRGPGRRPLLSGSSRRVGAPVGVCLAGGGWRSLGGGGEVRVARCRIVGGVGVGHSEFAYAASAGSLGACYAYRIPVNGYSALHA